MQIVEKTLTLLLHQNEQHFQNQITETRFYLYTNIKYEQENIPNLTMWRNTLTIKLCVSIVFPYIIFSDFSEYVGHPISSDNCLISQKLF